MFEKLKAVEQRYEEINTLLTDPETVNDQQRYRGLMKEYKNLTPVVEKFREYSSAKQSAEEAAELL
ncbi:MAG: PCRF domain-containing protein, partial [Oscillospiraceae bacterium]|nr:PCRF domain-containing protein [Oscillospiraceae bacterium]